MKLFLKDGIIYFKDKFLTSDDSLKVELDMPEWMENKTKHIQVNDGKKKPFNKYTYLSEEQLNKDDFQIKVYVQQKVYKSERIPLKKLIAVGGDPSDAYPEQVAELRADVKTLRKDMNIMKKAMVEMAEKGEVI